MSAREWQVGLVGTFDVENYGDLLFPLIAEAELAKRLGRVRLHRFSYRAKTADTWPYPVTSVTELPRLAAGLDALLVGGGFVIRFDKDVAPGYGPPTPTIHHPTGYWLTPALIALQHGIPLIWNAPGMHCNDIPAWADPLMELVFSLSSYVAVRDEPSRAALGRFADPDRIAVVPDTGFGIACRLGERPSFEFDRVRDASGLRRPYIVVQAARDTAPFLGFVRRHADGLRDFGVLALPIGPVLGDDAAILEADLPGILRLPVWPHPLVLAEVIRQAVAVAGHSYHLAITALAAGVPVFSPCGREGKYSALAGFERIYPLPTEQDSDLGQFVSRLGRTAPAGPVRAALDWLSGHWDRIADVVQGGATSTPVAIGRFWQSLPGVLETATAPRPARSPELEALEMERASAQARIAELSLLLALARTEIVTRDCQIAAILESTSWRVTAPIRFAGRRLRR